MLFRYNSDVLQVKIKYFTFSRYILAVYSGHDALPRRAGRTAGGGGEAAGPKEAGSAET